MRTLYVDVSKKHVRMFFIVDEVVNGLKMVGMPEGAIVDTELVNADFVHHQIKTYTKKMLIKDMVIIAHIKPIVRFISYPQAMTNKDIKNELLHNMEDYLPIDLGDYTTGYTVVSKGDKIKVQLVTAKTRVLESYIKIAKYKKIRAIHANVLFVSNYIANRDKGNIVVGVTYGDTVLLQFLKDGASTMFAQCDYTNMDRLFSSFTDVYGRLLLERAYFAEGIKEVLVDYLKSKGDITVISGELYEL